MILFLILHRVNWSSVKDWGNKKVLPPLPAFHRLCPKIYRRTRLVRKRAFCRNRSLQFFASIRSPLLVSSTPPSVRWKQVRSLPARRLTVGLWELKSMCLLERKFSKIKFLQKEAALCKRQVLRKRPSPSTSIRITVLSPRLGTNAENWWSLRVSLVSLKSQIWIRRVLKQCRNKQDWTVCNPNNLNKKRTRLISKCNEENKLNRIQKSSNDQKSFWTTFKMARNPQRRIGTGPTTAWKLMNSIVRTLLVRLPKPKISSMPPKKKGRLNQTTRQNWSVKTLLNPLTQAAANIASCNKLFREIAKLLSKRCPILRPSPLHTMAGKTRRWNLLRLATATTAHKQTRYWLLSVLASQSQPRSCPSLTTTWTSPTSTR